MVGFEDRQCNLWTNNRDFKWYEQ